MVVRIVISVDIYILCAKTIPSVDFLINSFENNCYFKSIKMSSIWNSIWELWNMKRWLSFLLKWAGIHRGIICAKWSFRRKANLSLFFYSNDNKSNDVAKSESKKKKIQTQTVSSSYWLIFLFQKARDILSYFPSTEIILIKHFPSPSSYAVTSIALKVIDGKCFSIVFYKLKGCFF